MRYMKKLKGFFRKMEKLEGSMKEGYIVYESFYYASEYIKKIDNTTEAFVWDDHQDEEKMEGTLLQMNGKRYLINSKSIIFCQFSTEKLFALKYFIPCYCFEFLYTSTNL
jgi:hypothetical protein